MSDSEHQVQTHRDRDDRQCVGKTHNNEKLSAEHWDQLGLTRRTFEKAASEDTDADCGAESAQTQHETGCDENNCLCKLHNFPLNDA